MDLYVNGLIHIGTPTGGVVVGREWCGGGAGRSERRVERLLVWCECCCGGAGVVS